MRWFTSDWHFGHDKVARLRGYADTSEHDAVIVANARRLIAAKDDLYFLGDLTLSTPEKIWHLVDQIPGRKIAIVGNHDAPHPVHANGWKHLPEWLEHFAAVTTATTLRISGTRVKAMHLPYLGGGDHTADDRYTEWRVPASGPLLCGHVHAKWKTNGEQINVGVDVWNMEPVSETQVGKLIDAFRSCPDCGVLPGEEHHDGCDVARCLFNGMQRLMCGGDGASVVLEMYGYAGKEHHDCGHDVWTGQWPGALECEEYGWYTDITDGRGGTIRHVHDLNRLATEGRWDRDARRWVKR